MPTKILAESGGKLRLFFAVVNYARYKLSNCKINKAVLLGTK
jgi:hypothetical protein